MSKSHLKSTIRKAQAGIAFIILAAVLSQFLYVAQYIYTRRKIHQQTVEKTSSDMERMQRITNRKTSVESAVHATMGDVRVNLNDPDMFYGVVSRLVSNNDHIVGSAIAMRPGYFPDKDKLFAPFAYPENLTSKSQPRTKLLPYDYTKQEWYAIPFEKDSAIWSEPYYDKGGSDMLICTYSLPIHDQGGDVIGILTADVFFKDMAADDDFSYDEIDRANLVGFIFQILSLLLIAYIVWKYASKLRQVNHLIMEQELLGKELQIASDIQSAMLPNVSELENARHHLDIQKTLASTINHNEMFSTLFVGVLDLNSALLTYCNAGNPAPVVISPSTGAKLMDVEPNIPVGIMENYEYIEQHITLIEDFTLFLYNDGLYETTNLHHEPYGQKRMLTRLEACARHNDEPKKILSTMQEAVESHRGSALQTDDLLMLTIRMV